MPIVIRGAPIGPPDRVSADVVAVWVDLAPHAHQKGTLTQETRQAFADLCRAIVLRDRMAAAIEADGLTYDKITIDGAGQEHQERKPHPLLSQHRGMMQRVEAGFQRFMLAPIGKPAAQAPPPEDPFAQFDDEPQ